MSAGEILTELPNLTHAERREIAKRVFELEAEAQLSKDADLRANENFLMIDAIEAEDAQKQD